MKTIVKKRFIHKKLMCFLFAIALGINILHAQQRCKRLCLIYAPLGHGYSVGAGHGDDDYYGHKDDVNFSGSFRMFFFREATSLKKMLRDSSFVLPVVYVFSGTAPDITYYFNYKRDSSSVSSLFYKGLLESECLRDEVRLGKGLFLEIDFEYSMLEGLQGAMAYTKGAWTVYPVFFVTKIHSWRLLDMPARLQKRKKQKHKHER